MKHFVSYFHLTQTEKTSEFKVNVTETEFVILEDTASIDSNAVILKVNNNLCDWIENKFVQIYLDINSRYTFGVTITMQFCFHRYIPDL